MKFSPFLLSKSSGKEQKLNVDFNNFKPFQLESKTFVVLRNVEIFIVQKTFMLFGELHFSCFY